MNFIRACVVFWILAIAPASSPAQDAELENAPDHRPLRLAVVGLVHGHVEGLLWQANERPEIELVGVYDPDRALFDRMSAKHGLDASLYFDNLNAMLDARTPEAVSVMTSTFDHLMAVEACAPRGVHMLVEKPLAVSNAHASRMAALAREHRVHLLTNYETSWYASVHEARRLTRDGGLFTPVRRAVFRHGHRGPAEIGCSPEFLDWLTDPERNGAGALFDFGCYGANIMTWLRDGEAPLTVFATAHSNRPERYPGVDDDSTIVLTYPDAVAVVQGSWSWTHDNKSMDLYTPRGSIHCQKWDAMQTRLPDADPREIDPPRRPRSFRDEWAYLHAVVRADAPIEPLSSLENNLVVVRILDAARRSVETARAVTP